MLVYVVGLFSGGLILNNIVGYWAYIWGGGRGGGGGGGLYLGDLYLE